MRLLLLSLFLCTALCLTAQSSYSVTRDSTGKFLLLEGDQKTVFDTASVAKQLEGKLKDERDIKTEIEYLERLVFLRRQLPMVVEERKTLQDILLKAKQCSK